MAGEVQTPFARALINGVARPLKSFSITREISTDLPTAVVGGSDQTAADGTIVWADDVSGVASGRIDPPSPNASVTLEVGVDGSSGTRAQAFTGVIDKSGGKASDLSSQSSIVDRTSALDRPVTVPVHLAQEVSGVGTITKTGLSSMWMLHECARQLGVPAYHYTGKTVVWAALAGCILPASGFVPGYLDAGEWDPVQTPTGVGIAVAPNRFVEYGMEPIGTDGDKAVEFSLWCDPSDPGLTAVRLNSYNSTTGVTRGWYMYITAGSVVVYDFVGSTLGNQIVSTLANGWQPIAFHVTWASGGWTVRVRTSSGITPSGFTSDTTANTRAANEKWQTTVFRSPDSTTPATIAGFVLDRLPDATPRWEEHRYTPRFRTLSTTGDLNPWSASRFIDGQSGLAVMKGIAAAECAGLWIDEDGVLTWMSRTYMKNQPLGPVVTSTDNLLDYDWANTLDSLRSTVTVKHLMPAYSVRTGANLTVWAGNSDSRFKAGETSEQFVEPDTLEDWWQPDFAISYGNINAKPVTGTWWGGRVKVDATDANVRNPALSSDAAVSLTQLGPQKALLKISASSGLGAANYLDTTGTPVVRARGRAVWTDQAYTSTILGPSDAPALEHDAGWYVQWTGKRQQIADFLAAATNGVFPTFDNIQIVPDPTIRLGQKVTVRDTHAKGWRFDGIVFSVRLDGEEGSLSMSIGIRVTAFVPGFSPTLAQVDARWAGSTLTQVDAAHAGLSLTALDANPLV